MKNCVPASTTFTNGKVCTSSQFLQDGNSPPDNIPAACPAVYDSEARVATPRERLAPMVSCGSLTDRAACCKAVDGRTQAIHANQPCLPARRIFKNGNVCETARW